MELVGGGSVIKGVYPVLLNTKNVKELSFNIPPRFSNALNHKQLQLESANWHRIFLFTSTIRIQKYLGRSEREENPNRLS